MMALGKVLVAQRLEVDVLTANAVGAGLTVPEEVLLYEQAPFVSVMVIEPVPAVFHVTAIVASFALFAVTE
jgi:multisubunit Na+/H+ antiporter MnhC subunit